MDYESALARVIDDVVEPGAVAVDREGTYPRAQLEALGEAGILGLASSPDASPMRARSFTSSATIERGFRFERLLSLPR